METWDALASWSDDRFADANIGWVNLVCAAGLPGSEGLDVRSEFRKLKQWAATVRRKTALLRANVRADCWSASLPPGEFAMAVLTTVLQRDFGVCYYEQHIDVADASNSRTRFIHGILNDRSGTCASLPVLYVAIGRLLGYPLYLVQAKDHLFVRWDGAGERFNVEATARGFVSHPDEHYRAWPFRLDEVQLKSGHYLSNFSSRRELATCIHERALVLVDNLRFDEALFAYSVASGVDSAHDGGWAVATLLTLLFNGNARGEPLSDDRASERLASLTEPWERSMAPHALREFKRIKRLNHDRRRTFARDEVFTLFF